MEDYGIPKTVPGAFRQVLTYWPQHPAEWAVTSAMNPNLLQRPEVPSFAHLRSPGYWIILVTGVLAIIGLQTVLFGWPGWDAFRPTAGPLAP